LLSVARAIIRKADSHNQSKRKDGQRNRPLLADLYQLIAIDCRCTKL